MPWPLVAVLAVQATLSARMVRGQDGVRRRGAVPSAGHLEWSHWLHGTQIPDVPDLVFRRSGHLPAGGAIADVSAGWPRRGCFRWLFMLGVTCFLWSTANRLLADKRAAFFAAALFAVLAPSCTWARMRPTTPGAAAPGRGDLVCAAEPGTASTRRGG